MAFLNIRLWRTIALTCGIFCLPLTTFAATPEQIEAAFIYKFTKYVIWPDDAFESEEAPFRLCMAASSKFQSLMEVTVENEHIYKRNFDVVNLIGDKNKRECHLLFVDQAENSLYKLQAYQSLYDHNTLIISDIMNAAKYGSMIELRYEDGRFRIFINRKQSLSAGLQILSTLLNLAVLVDE